MSDWMLGGDAGIGGDSGEDWYLPPPAEIVSELEDIADVIDLLYTQDIFGDPGGGGYPGGPTPDGYRPHEDGTGRFMYDSQGRLQMNPNYAAWLNHPDQRIDWTGVGLDLGTILGGSYGGIAIGEVRGFIGWAIAYWSEYLDMGDRYGDPTDPND